MAATRAAATAAKAIYAEPVFIPKGPINSGRFNLIREITIGFGLGLTAGMMWKVRAVLDVQCHSLTLVLLAGPADCWDLAIRVAASVGVHHQVPHTLVCISAADVALGREASSGSVLLRAVCS